MALAGSGDEVSVWGGVVWFEGAGGVELPVDLSAKLPVEVPVEFAVGLTVLLAAVVLPLCTAVFRCGAVVAGEAVFDGTTVAGGAYEFIALARKKPTVAPPATPTTAASTIATARHPELFVRLRRCFCIVPLPSLFYMNMTVCSIAE